MVNATTVLAAVGAVIVVQRLTELRLAARNEAWARGAGAVEHGRGHYPLFFVLHTAWLLAWPAEALLNGPALANGWIVWAAVFAVAEGLRYWAILTLGRRWNTRVLVVPDLTPIARGPYRLMRHPNYVAVVLELFAVPLMFGAVWTAAVASVLNGALLLGVRIPVENRALGR